MVEDSEKLTQLIHLLFLSGDSEKWKSTESKERLHESMSAHVGSIFNIKLTSKRETMGARFIGASPQDQPNPSIHYLQHGNNGVIA